MRNVICNSFEIPEICHSYRSPLNFALVKDEKMGMTLDETVKTLLLNFDRIRSGDPELVTIGNQYLERIYHSPKCVALFLHILKFSDKFDELNISLVKSALRQYVETITRLNLEPDIQQAFPILIKSIHSFLINQSRCIAHDKDSVILDVYITCVTRLCHQDIYALECEIGRYFQDLANIDRIRYGLQVEQVIRDVYIKLFDVFPPEIILGYYDRLLTYVSQFFVPEALDNPQYQVIIESTIDLIIPMIQYWFPQIMHDPRPLPICMKILSIVVASGMAGEKITETSLPISAIKLLFVLAHTSKTLKDPSSVEACQFFAERFLPELTNTCFQSAQWALVSLENIPPISNLIGIVLENLDLVPNTEETFQCFYQLAVAYVSFRELDIMNFQTNPRQFYESNFENRRQREYDLRGAAVSIIHHLCEVDVDSLVALMKQTEVTEGLIRIASIVAEHAKTPVSTTYIQELLQGVVSVQPEGPSAVTQIYFVISAMGFINSEEYPKWIPVASQFLNSENELEFTVGVEMVAALAKHGVMPSDEVILFLIRNMCRCFSAAVTKAIEVYATKTENTAEVVGTCIKTLIDQCDLYPPINEGDFAGVTMNSHVGRVLRAITAFVKNVPQLTPAPEILEFLKEVSGVEGHNILVFSIGKEVLDAFAPLASPTFDIYLRYYVSQINELACASSFTAQFSSSIFTRINTFPNEFLATGDAVNILMTYLQAFCNCADYQTVCFACADVVSAILQMNCIQDFTQIMQALIQTPIVNVPLFKQYAFFAVFSSLLCYIPQAPPNEMIANWITFASSGIVTRPADQCVFIYALRRIAGLFPNMGQQIQAAMLAVQNPVQRPEFQEIREFLTENFKQEMPIMKQFQRK